MNIYFERRCEKVSKTLYFITNSPFAVSLWLQIGLTQQSGRILKTVEGYSDVMMQHFEATPELVFFCHLSEFDDRVTFSEKYMCSFFSIAGTYGEKNRSLPH